MTKPKLQVVPVFYDFEMTNLAADFGHMICASFKKYGEPEVTTLRIDRTAVGKVKPWNDSALAVQIRDQLEKQFLVVSYNGVMFDRKFLDTRLMGPECRERVVRMPLHKDLLWTAKRAFHLSSNRLQTIQEYLGLSSSKTRLDPALWNRAAAGHTPAIDYVVEHCEADVRVLEELFEYLIPFVQEVHS